MKIYLLRHGQAGGGHPDASRILTEQGRAHAQQLGEFLRRKETAPPAVLWCSPYRRARETANIVLDAWGMAVTDRKDEARLEPEMNPSPLVDEFRQLDQDLLVVGHNPNISILASLLLNAERGRIRVNFQTCIMACLEMDPIPNHGEVGPCKLSWMLDPRVL
jgi:phosphohistidine phosphatase